MMPKNDKNLSMRLEDVSRPALKISEAAAILGISKSALTQRLRRHPDWVECIQIGALKCIKTDSLRRAYGLQQSIGEKQKASQA